MVDLPWRTDGVRTVTADSFCDLPLWYAEGFTICFNRMLLGDERAMNLAETVMTPEEQWEMGKRHPRHAASMLKSKRNQNN